MEKSCHVNTNLIFSLVLMTALWKRDFIAGKKQVFELFQYLVHNKYQSEHELNQCEWKRSNSEK